jgi:hypothetical protein
MGRVGEGESGRGGDDKPLTLRVLYEKPPCGRLHGGLTGPHDRQGVGIGGEPPISARWLTTNH